MAGRLKNLFFAGEATHEDWYGYLQGVYFSGFYRAREIAESSRERSVSHTSLPQVYQ